MTDELHPALEVERLTVAYNGTSALNGVSLRVRRGEFLTLLGPSGCGKTTLLRAIAGFLFPDDGEIKVMGEPMGRRPAHRRPVNTVFQRPTLLPNLNALDNVALGLRLEGLGKKERRARAAEMLALVHLKGYENRRPHELSGGQQQRVGLARALAKRPQLLLLDEPLSALDLSIRLGMEEELRRVHRETGAAFVYVTHDQREALALSDRIAVMRDGRIEQLAPPDEIYRRPATPFAARFVGNANVLPAEVGDPAAGCLRDGSFIVADAGRPTGAAVWLVLRPEFVRFTRRDDADSIPSVVADLAYRGTSVSCRFRVDSTEQVVAAEIPVGECGDLAIGERVRLTWDSDTGVLLERDPNDRAAAHAAAPGVNSATDDDAADPL